MITKIIREENIEKVKKIIDKNSKFAIVTHISPDGDAVGASLGLYNYFSEIDKDAVVIFNDSVSDNLRWMPGIKDSLYYEQYKQECSDILENADVIFCLDFNTPKRMGELSELVLKSKAIKILVDHHLYPGDFCQVIISHPEISSASELIFRLICRMGEYENINYDCATCIYTGMMTDTGAFTYNSNNPEIYVIISQLLKIGINKDWIYDQVNNHFSENRERLMGYTISQKMRTYPQFKSAIITLNSEELIRYDYKKGDTEGFVNIPLSIKGIVFSAFFREDKDYIKISLRSKGDFPANKIAEMYFNGGGHKNAAGGEYFGSLDEAIARLEEVIPAFNEYFNDKN
ncbi:MAG: bifunctional oligoribonuclease/PAP phosphatase NrnA [Bacteroidales bacterium]|nr:bifunctional oligoribonuclease/PAP phosphatase NrnA [Bacteroidales bacterium]